MSAGWYFDCFTLWLLCIPPLEVQCDTDNLVVYVQPSTTRLKLLFLLSLINYNRVAPRECYMLNELNEKTYINWGWITWTSSIPICSNKLESSVFHTKYNICKQNWKFWLIRFKFFGKKDYGLKNAAYFLSFFLSSQLSYTVFKNYFNIDTLLRDLAWWPN